MRARLLTGVSATLLFLAPYVAAQNDARSAADTKTDEAAQEARRQARVNPNTGQSPSQTMRQAIAFERFKDRAAARQARLESRGGTNSNADRRREDTASRKKESSTGKKDR